MSAALAPRFNPPIIIVNQGDTVQVTFISNDTEDGHTFEFNLPNGTTWVRLNASEAGLENFLNEQKFVGPPTGCVINGHPAPCDTSGTIGNLTAVGTFTTSGLQPGIYRFICLYHQGIGMYGFLLIVPNKAASGG
jgi:plastocyanin